MTMTNRPVDREHIAAKVRDILVEQLGVSLEQLTLDASLIHDLGAEEEDLDEVVYFIAAEFNIPDFDGVTSDTRVGELIDAVVDVLVNVLAEGPGR